MTSLTTDQVSLDDLYARILRINTEKAQVKMLVGALYSEPLYENGKKESGISVKFLARLTLLRSAVGFDIPDVVVDDAIECLRANVDVDP